MVSLLARIGRVGKVPSKSTVASADGTGVIFELFGGMEVCDRNSRALTARSAPRGILFRRMHMLEVIGRPFLR